MVEIDRDTGAVSIRDMVLVDDCGTVINPRPERARIAGERVNNWATEALTFERTRVHQTPSGG